MRGGMLPWQPHFEPRKWVSKVVAMVTYTFIGVLICPSDRDSYTCCAVLLGCTCDLPARAMVMNCVQYNGFYGCPRCLQPGVKDVLIILLLLVYCYRL